MIGSPLTQPIRDVLESSNRPLDLRGNSRRGPRWRPDGETDARCDRSRATPSGHGHQWAGRGSGTTRSTRSSRPNAWSARRRPRSSTCTSLTADIENRAVPLKPYGVAFTKMIARRHGVEDTHLVRRHDAGTHLAAEGRDRSPTRARQSRPEHSTLSRSPDSPRSSSKWAPGPPAGRSSGGSASGDTSATYRCQSAG